MPDQVFLSVAPLLTWRELEPALVDHGAIGQRHVAEAQNAAREVEIAGVGEGHAVVGRHINAYFGLHIEAAGVGKDWA